MGLDITAYSKLVHIDPPADVMPDQRGEWAYGNGYTTLSINPDFPGRADEFNSADVYKYEKCIGFRAGSYGGYNAWREWLARLVGTTPEQAWRDPKPGPFHELINFSDCDGTLGTAVCAKLAKDFAEFQDKANAAPAEGPWYRERYSSWRAAFELAADGGAVLFR